MAPRGSVYAFYFPFQKAFHVIAQKISISRAQIKEKFEFAEWYLSSQSLLCGLGMPVPSIMWGVFG